MSTQISGEMNENPLAHESAAAEMSDDALDAVVEYSDTTRDINVPIAPPPAGRYPIRWKSNSNKKDGGIFFKPSDKVGWFLNVYVLGLVQSENPEINEFMVSDYMNSIQRRGTSDVAHFLNCCGSPIPNRISNRELREKVVEVLAQEPISESIIEWKASIKDQNEKSGYRDIAKRMTDFPRLEDGSYQPWIEIPDDEGEVQKIYANAYIFAHVLPNS